MRPLRLNRRLTLEAAQRVPDGAGGYSETWVTQGEVWAQVQASTGRERAGEELGVSTVRYKIVVRGAPFGAPSRPTSEQRFREGTRIFRILAVAERDPEGRYLTCFATEETVA